MATDETTPKKQVMDISAPGKTPTNATSRPVIVGHGSMMKDPMVKEVVEAEDAEVKEKPEEKIISTTAKTVQPLTSAEDSKEKTKPEEKADDKTEDTPSSDESTEGTAIVDAVVGQIGDKKKDDAEEQADKEAASRHQKLISEKTYFLPIGRVKHRRHVRNLIMGIILLILLCGAGLVAAIDAGLLKAPFTLPFDLIPDQTVPTDTDTTQPDEAASAAAETEANATTEDSELAAAVADDEQTVDNPVPATAEDQTRVADLTALQAVLEGYYNETGQYPTRERLNDTAFRTDNLAGSSRDYLTDPANEANAVLVAEPTAGSYAYSVTSKDDQPCDNTVVLCEKFLLSATLSTGEVYKKQSL